jgi:rare lipoprotein A (peptidoglycan hydrolase)
MRTLVKIAIFAYICGGCMTYAEAQAPVRHPTFGPKLIHKHLHEQRHEVRRENHHVIVSRTGHVQVGKASVYSSKFAGRRMASGEKFNPASNSAASRSLPLGTVANVTNTENGRTATVRILDRGPWRAGRILDVSPKTADKLGIPENGVGNVVIAPIAIAETERGTRFR